MKEEFNRIKKISKEIIGKKSYKRVKKIKDYSDRTEGLKHLVHSKLDLRLLNIEHKLGALSKEKKENLDPKLTRLKSKIKIFNSTHSEKDHKVLKNLFNDIEKECENV